MIIRNCRSMEPETGHAHLHLAHVKLFAKGQKISSQD